MTNEVEQQQRGRRRNWIVGAAAALAGVAVITTLVVTGGSGSDNTASSASSAATSSSSAAAPMAAAPSAESELESSVSTEQSPTAAADSAPSDSAGSAPAPNAAASSAASEFASEQASEAGEVPPPPPVETSQPVPPPADTEPVAPDPTCTGIPLSEQQTGLVTGTLGEVAPVAMTPDGCDLTDDLTAVANFAGTGTAEGAVLSVEVRQPALPSCEGCTAVSDEIDSLVYGDNSQFTRIFAQSTDSTLVLIATPADGGTAAPFTVEQLAAVAEALLPTL